MERILSPVGHKVKAIANHDNFTIYPQVMDDYVEMALRLKERFFEASSVYTTSAFLHLKFGDALKTRGVAPHIAWTHDEALAVLSTGPKSES